MKSLARVLFTVASGAALGWLLPSWVGPSPRVVDVIPLERAPTPPPVPAPPAWREWLASVTLADAPVEAGAFWAAVAARPATASLARGALALDEALASLPPDQLRLVLADERFARLPEVLSTEEAPTRSGKIIWMQRLLRLPPDQALALCEQFDVPFLRSRLEAQLRAILSRTDPEAAFSWLRKRGNVNAMAGLLGDVAKTDLDKATAMWGQLDDRARAASANSIMSALLKQDWQAALAWAQQQLPEETRLGTIDWLFDRVGPGQKTSLLEAAREMADPALRSIVYSKAITNDREIPPVAMMAEALALPADSLDDQGWSTLGQACAARLLRKPDPAASAAQLEDLAASIPGSGQAAFLKRAAIMAGWNDHALCAQLFAYLPESHARTMAGDWAQADPTAVSAWLRTLEPSAKRDEAVAGFCRSMAAVDPPNVAQWALTIQEADQRGPVLRDALSAWKHSDPAAAGAWADAQGVELPSP